MFDLLAAISSVDPPSLVAWLVFLFAAGMYPVGIMLGSSCSPCCTQTPPCTQCTEGELPDTLTVTFSGLADKAPGPDLISLSFSSCYGSGAAATVTAPAGDPATDKGPIGTVNVTNGGSGYAKLGRVAPTLTVSGGSGTGATFTPSLSASQDGCELDLWALSSVAASGGTGYVDGESLTITAAAGDTEQQAATAIIHTVYDEPAVELSVAGGSGAVLTPTLTSNFGYYTISAVAIADGGTGYSQSEVVTATVTDGQEVVGMDARVNAVDENGAITEISIYYGGSYLNDTGVPASVEVTNGGSYYREDASATPYVADITVSVSQTLPSNGTGASLSVTIDDDTSSETFGQITGVNIDNGGDGYLAHELLDTCLTRFDGRSVVVERNRGLPSPFYGPPDPCVYRYSCAFDGACCLEFEFVHVIYNGPTQPITIQMFLALPNGGVVNAWVVNAFAEMTADALSPDCSNIDVTATGGTDVPEGATAHVVAGGEYEETETCKKILVEDYEGLTAEIEWDGWSYSLGPGYTGTSPCGKNVNIDGNVAHVLLGGCGRDAWFSLNAASDCEKYPGVGSVSSPPFVEFGVELRGCKWEMHYSGAVMAGGAYYDYGSLPSPGPIRLCYCSYRVTGYSLDGDGFPTGALTIVSDGCSGDYFESRDWFYGLGPCVDPGVPSITVSRLP